MCLGPRFLKVGVVWRAVAARARILLARTMLPLLAAAGLQALHPIVAHAATSFVFTGQGEPSHSQWTVPGNWSPEGIPGPDDDVIIGPPGHCSFVQGIPPGTVIHGLTLGCSTPGTTSTLSCQKSNTEGICGGDLTVTTFINWTGGTIVTPLTVAVGGVVDISGSDPKALTKGGSGLAGAGVFNLAGSATLSGNLSLGGIDGAAVLDNTGTFTALPGASMTSPACCQNPSQFRNEGSFVVPGPGTVLIFFVSYNDSGDTTIAAGGLLELQGAPSIWSCPIPVTFSAGGQTRIDHLACSVPVTFSGGGRTLIDHLANVSLQGGVVGLPANVVVGPGHTLELGADASTSAGSISGNGVLSGGGSFVWSAGQLPDTLSVDSTVTTVIRGSAPKTLGVLGVPGSGALNLAGTTTVSGTLGMWAPAVLTNTGTFAAQPGAVIAGLSSSPRFINQGTLVNDSGSSTTLITNVDLANSGDIELTSGILRVAFPTFTQPAGATLGATIRGTTPGTDFGQLQVSNSATLDGGLILANGSGFVPMPGQTFPVITCGTACSGTFASVSVNYSALYHPQDVTLIPLVSIALDPPNPTIVKGTTQQFTATGTYGDGSIADLSSQVTWASQDVTIATIDQAGLATGIGPGTATISATADTIRRTTTITVTV